MKMMPQQPPPMVPPRSPIPPGAGPQGLGGNPNLRPRDAFEVFREGFAMAGKWFPAFVLTIVIVALIQATTTYIFPEIFGISLNQLDQVDFNTLPQDLFQQLLVFLIFNIILAIIIKAIFSASMATFVFAALHYQKTGQKMPLGEAFKHAQPYLVTFILLDVIVHFLIYVGIGFFLIPGLFFAVWWSVVLPIMFDEKKGISDAMARSKDLVQGFKWHVLGYIILINLVGEFIRRIVQDSPSVITNPTLYFMVMFIGSFLIFFFDGVDYMARAVLYMDLLARQHQRQMMMAMYYQQYPPPQLGMVPPVGVPPPSPQYPQAQAGPQSSTLPSAYQYSPPTSSTTIPTCQSCGSPVEVGARFCPNCGAPVTRVPTSSPSAQAGLRCKACGHVNPDDALFCENCGTRLQ